MYFTFKISSISVCFLNLHGNHHAALPEIPEQCPNGVRGAVSSWSRCRKLFLAHGSGALPAPVKLVRFLQIHISAPPCLTGPASSSSPLAPRIPDSLGLPSPPHPNSGPSHQPGMLFLGPSSSVGFPFNCFFLQEAPSLITNAGHMLTYRRLPGT